MGSQIIAHYTKKLQSMDQSLAEALRLLEPLEVEFTKADHVLFNTARYSTTSDLGAAAARYIMDPRRAIGDINISEIGDLTERLLAQSTRIESTFAGGLIEVAKEWEELLRSLPEETTDLPITSLLDKYDSSFQYVYSRQALDRIRLKKSELVSPPEEDDKKTSTNSGKRGGRGGRERGYEFYGRKQDTPTNLHTSGDISPHEPPPITKPPTRETDREKRSSQIAQNYISDYIRRSAENKKKRAARVQDENDREESQKQQQRKISQEKEVKNKKRRRDRGRER